MSEKRKRNDDDKNTKSGETIKKKQRRGFQVGPDNLPDGIYKRKTQKIKQSLIDSAKIKKNYAKLKSQGKVPDEEESIPIPASAALDEGVVAGPEPSTEPHPDRQTLMDLPEPQPDQPLAAGTRHRKRRPKVIPFKKEYEEGQRRKAEAEERRVAREKAELERKTKLEERERFRSAMAKARTGGRNGQRKLGRESQPLLERVQRMMAGRTG